MHFGIGAFHNFRICGVWGYRASNRRSSESTGGHFRLLKQSTGCMMLKSAWPIGLGLFTMLVLLALYTTFSDTSRSISPQGCRMSWMSPSYVHLSQFNSSRTSLGSRYSLWLYREVGWDANEVSLANSGGTTQKAKRPCDDIQVRGDGVPVLFIPGNAGSSHQIRSIASSSTRQYYSSPGAVATEFATRSLKPLDFYSGTTVRFVRLLHTPS